MRMQQHFEPMIQIQTLVQGQPLSQPQPQVRHRLKGGEEMVAGDFNKLVLDRLALGSLLLSKLSVSELIKLKATTRMALC